VNVIGTQFDPPLAWTGSGSARISDASTGGGPLGLTSAENGDNEMPMLSRGAISFERGTLTGANVSAGVLTLPAGSYFTIAHSGPVAITSVVGGDMQGRVVTFRNTGTNVTWTDGAGLLMNGNFAVAGTITFLFESSGGTYTGYEIARTAY
jgi:hypothetical protein